MKLNMIMVVLEKYIFQHHYMSLNIIYTTDISLSKTIKIQMENILYTIQNINHIMI